MPHTVQTRANNKPSALHSAAFLLALATTVPFAHTQQLKIRILNAQTNKPITDEQLNVALRFDQIGSVAMPTDKHGLIAVDTHGATIIRILSNMYADCRSRGELYTNYPVATILKTGITTGNLCSSASPAPRPGELLLFEKPKDYIPTMHTDRMQHPEKP